MKESLNLAALRAGESGYVTQLRAQPAMERRLMDLGLVPGTRVTCLLKRQGGGLGAYLIRGALIALRQADAQGVDLAESLPAAAGPAAP